MLARSRSGTEVTNEHTHMQDRRTQCETFPVRESVAVIVSERDFFILLVVLSYFFNDGPQRHVGGQSVYARRGQFHYAAAVGAF